MGRTLLVARGISALAGILMVWIFGKVSNQKAIEKTRGRLSAELIALRLFKDDLRVFFGIQYQILVWTLKYLRYSLFPMLVLMLPTMLILIELNLHYGNRPLRVGEETLVKVKLREPAALAGGVEISLQAPDNLKIETQAVRIEELREVCWRVRGAAPGRFDLKVSDGKLAVTKRVAVGGPLEGVSSVRTGENWGNNSALSGRITIRVNLPSPRSKSRYPALDIPVLGKRVNWLVLFLVLSLAFGYAFKGLLGVQI